MKRFYKYFLTISFMFAVLPLSAQDTIVDVSRLQGQINGTLENALSERALYPFVKQELSNYYGKNDFADLNHQTGWYRVDDFLKWLKKNEKTLQNEIVRVNNKERRELKELYAEDNYVKENYRNVFWVYLGVRYIVNVYNASVNLKALKIYNACSETSASPLLGEIYLCIDSEATLPYLVNIGIHEMTHLFPRLYTGPISSSTALKFSLSELATFYSTRNYGFPVKSEDATGMYNGVRDINRIIALRPDFDILNEYNAYLGGLLITNITKKDILSMYDETLSSEKILEFAFNCPAIKENKFFIMKAFKYTTALDDMDEREVALLKENKYKAVYLGQKDSEHHIFAKWSKGDETASIDFFTPLTMQDYTKHIFGKYANTEVNNFYTQFCNKMPQDFIDEVNETFEVQTNDTYKDNEGISIVRRYEKEIRDVLFKLLEEKNIPQAKIPEGYI